ncbi:calcium binding EGF domain protein [Cooperia oncophora]
MAEKGQRNPSDGEEEPWYVKAMREMELICPPGWQTLDNENCVDIDECLLLMDDCLESQRCLNLPGSFKCIRTLSCGTGYAMDSETEECIGLQRLAVILLTV